MCNLISNAIFLILNAQKPPCCAMVDMHVPLCPVEVNDGLGRKLLPNNIRRRLYEDSG